MSELRYEVRATVEPASLRALRDLVDNIVRARQFVSEPDEPSEDEEEFLTSFRQRSHSWLPGESSLQINFSQSGPRVSFLGVVSNADRARDVLLGSERKNLALSYQERQVPELGRGALDPDDALASLGELVLEDGPALDSWHRRLDGEGRAAIARALASLKADGGRVTLNGLAGEEPL